jgi:uncharacterized protein YijF (DUF1287 family)
MSWLRNQKTFFLERPIVVAFGRYVVALPLHNMPPKKRKQDDSAAEADDAKPEPEIDHAQSAIEHISHCTMEELKLVYEASRRRIDRLSLLAANAFNPGDTVTWAGKNGVERTGTVTKVNPKTVAVTTHGPDPKRWTVSATMLTKKNSEH